MIKRNWFENILFKITLWLRSITPKERKLKSILERLNAWSEAGKFLYSEYDDFEGTRRYEFRNDYIKITYFPEYEQEKINGSSGFWFGVKHHFPMKLAKDITSFLYKYGK